MLKVQRQANLQAKREPFPHQVEALEALKDMPYAAVFHEQGLGKTKIGLDLALSWLARDIVDSVIIVTKKALVDVAARNRNVADAQSRVNFDAQSVRTSAAANALYVRLNAGSVRRTRDQTFRRTLSETGGAMSKPL